MKINKKEEISLKNKNQLFKKGTFVKSAGSIYMIIGFVRNEEKNEMLAYAIRVCTKNGRFNIKDFKIFHKWWFNSTAFKLVDDNFYIDKRDIEIKNKFVNLINSKELFFENIPHHFFRHNYHIRNINLSEFKKYSNNI